MWRRLVNRLLRHTIGYELTRPPGPGSWRIPPPRGERLLVAPVFIFSPARSGSTLLRSILGAHSQLYTPPEIPLNHFTVGTGTQWAQASLKAIQLTARDLDFMLWDRLLADTLLRSGKPTIVVKTPANVLIWKRISQCWPDARYLFLLRHPAACVASLHASWKAEWHPGESGTLAESSSKGLRYMSELDRARHTLPGHTLRYEDLTASPETVIRGVCQHLEIPFEPGMLEYGRFNRGSYVPGLGDASEKIRSGAIQPPGPPPARADIPAELLGICAAWGYLDGPPPGPGDGPATPGRSAGGPGISADQPANASGDGQEQTRLRSP